MSVLLLLLRLFLLLCVFYCQPDSIQVQFASGSVPKLQPRWYVPATVPEQLITNVLVSVCHRHSSSELHAKHVATCMLSSGSA